jgi:parallel beta-helix repeat protein
LIIALLKILAKTGIQGEYTASKGTVIKNCLFSEINNDGIALSIYFENATISNNTIQNVGMNVGGVVKGGKNGSGSGLLTAISVTGKGSLIEYNSVSNAGYHGIVIKNDNSVVRYNYVDNFCQILTDGGGIYMWNGIPSGVTKTGIKIHHNIVGNRGTEKGIYLDDEMNGVSVHDNVVFGCNIGIFLHNVYNVGVRDNTIFDNERGLYLVRDNRTTLPWKDVELKQNKVIAKTSSQIVIGGDFMERIIPGLVSDSNYLARPIDQSKIVYFFIRYPSWAAPRYTLSEWQSYSGQDMNSQGSPVAITSENDMQLEYNATKSSKTVSLSQPMIDIKGTKYATSITLQPYTSVVLMKDPKPDLSSDVTKPVVTAFSIPATSTSLVVAISSFTASDNKAVTGYLVTESSTAPLAGNAGWTTAAPTSYSFASEGTKTLYAWAKDAAGNVSASLNGQVTISLPDVTKPVVTAFTIPSTATSLLVSVTSFTASDNKAVSGYLLTESSTAPLAGNAGWTAAAPTSYSFASEGTKTLYAWAKDAAGNVSAGMSAQVNIALPDLTKPVVTAFSIPSTSTSLLVSVISFTTSDNKAVTGYLLTESSTAPLAGNAGWTASAPTSYSFASEGTKTLYAWAKDAAGNVSASLNGQVTISLPDVTKPVVTAFTIPSTSTSLLVSVTNFTASDNKAVTGYLLTESSTAPLTGNAGWTASAPTSYSFASEGTKTLYAWAKDAAGNVSASLNGQVTISLPDVTKPVVTAFTIPSTATSLLVSVTSFTASDNKAVSGYLLTESSTAPLAGNAGWTAAAPTSYSFASEGTKTLYAWAKDAAGNVSAGMSAQVNIALPDVTKPVVTAFSIPSTSTSLLVSVTNFTASDNKAVTGYLLTESSTAPLAGNAGWTASAPTSYSFALKEPKPFMHGPKMLPGMCRLA